MGCHFLLQGIFPTQGLNQVFCVSCLAGRFFKAEPSGKPHSGTLGLFVYLNKYVLGIYCMPSTT